LKGLTEDFLKDRFIKNMNYILIVIHW